MTTPATALVAQLQNRLHEVQTAPAFEVHHPDGHIERVVPDLSTLGHFQAALAALSPLAEAFEADYASYTSKKESR